MDAYCKAVRHLEEKFDGLELNPVLRKYNKATDALANMASERATVPLDVFVSDLYKPSVDYRDDGGSDQPPSDSGPDPKVSTAQEQEAMDIESEPPAPDQTGATPCCNVSSTALCAQTRLRHGVWLIAPRLSSFSTERCTSAAPRVSLCAASHVRRESSSWRTYTRGLAATTPRLGR